MLSRSNSNEKYREFINRDYSKFKIEEFLCMVKEGLDQRVNLEINERAEIFVQNIVAALDKVAPKKKFRILKIWEGKNVFGGSKNSD